MDAEDIKQIFDAHKHEYAIFKFIDGSTLTAEKVVPFSTKSIFANDRYLVNLDNVKHVYFAKDEYEASNAQRKS